MPMTGIGPTQDELYAMETAHLRNRGGYRTLVTRWRRTRTWTRGRVIVIRARADYLRRQGHRERAAAERAKADRLADYIERIR